MYNITVTLQGITKRQ